MMWLDIEMQYDNYNKDMFLDNLGKFTFVSDDLNIGQYKVLKEEAMDRPYIMPNCKKRIWAMTFDIDKPNSGYLWYDNLMPEPNWCVKNKGKEGRGRCHYGYALRVPVSRSENSLIKVQNLYTRIEHAMSKGLQSDPSYNHRLTKTPDHKDYQTIWGRSEPYDFEELRGYFYDNLPLVRKPELVIGEGRNVSLFTSLRSWSYRAYTQYDNYEDWLRSCYKMGLEYNKLFNCPLPLSEVRGTCRSVAKWVWERFSSSAFSKIQSFRGKRSVVKRKINLRTINHKKLENRFDRLAKILTEEQIIC